MKKILPILFICVLSCKSQSQKQDDQKEIEHYIIGEWYTIFKEEPEIIEDTDESYLEAQFEIESNLKIFTQNQYTKENKFTSKDLLKITYLHSTGSVTMNFRITSSGIWSIKNNQALFDTNFPSIDIDFEGSNASSANERELVKFYSKEIVSSLKNELLENEDKPSRIIEINKTTMKLKDGEGDILKYKRLSKIPKEFDISFLPNENFSAEKLRAGASLFDKLSVCGDCSKFMLGAVIPKSDEIKFYNNKELKGRSIHKLKPRKIGSQPDRALIVFDISKDDKCTHNFKALSKTGHFGWISGCTGIDKKWMNIEEAFKKNTTTEYKQSWTIKELERTYNR